MELDICLVGARYRCIINNKYSVIVNVNDHVDKNRYDTIEYFPFCKDGETIKKLPDLDETKVKDRIFKLIKSIEEPLIKKKE